MEDILEITKKQKIEDYQLRELAEGKLFINKYDLSLKYDYEMAVHWKEFFFDILKEMAKKDDVFLVQQNLFDYMKKEYYNIIKDNKLKTDIRDYIELNDYLTFQTWDKLVGNFLIKEGLDYYLVHLEQ